MAALGSQVADKKYLPAFVCAYVMHNAQGTMHNVCTTELLYLRMCACGALV